MHSVNLRASDWNGCKSRCFKALLWCSGDNNFGCDSFFCKLKSLPPIQLIKMIHPIFMILQRLWKVIENALVTNMTAVIIFTIANLILIKSCKHWGNPFYGLVGPSVSIIDITKEQENVCAYFKLVKIPCTGPNPRMGHLWPALQAGILSNCMHGTWENVLFILYLLFWCEHPEKLRSRAIFLKKKRRALWY